MPAQVDMNFLTLVHDAKYAARRHEMCDSGVKEGFPGRAVILMSLERDASDVVSGRRSLMIHEQRDEHHQRSTKRVLTFGGVMECNPCNNFCG